MEKMEDQIKMLIELQGLDAEIFGKKAVLDGFPEKMQELDSELERRSAGLKDLEEEFKKVHAKQKEREAELGSKEQSVKKYQTQLFQIKTNKEYTSLEKEIAGIKADSSVLEEEIIGLLDEADEVKKKIEKEKKLLEDEKKKIGEEKKKLEAERKEAEEQFNKLNNQRKEFASRIEKGILSKYERILHNRSGLAMVPIVEDACGGCNMNLPPQVINEARMKKDLLFCGNCARILYTKE